MYFFSSVFCGQHDNPSADGFFPESHTPHLLSAVYVMQNSIFGTQALFDRTLPS